MSDNPARRQHRRRVLYVVYCLDPGGAENVVATLATQIDATRFECEVAALTHGGIVADRLVSAGVPVHILGKRVGFELGVTRRLRRLIYRRGYALVHTHGTSANLWTVLACLFRRRPPIVQTLHFPAQAAFGWRQRTLRSLCGLRNEVIVGVSRMVTESHREVDPLNRRRYRTLHNGIEPLPRGTDDERSRLRANLDLPADAVVVGTVGNLRPPKSHSDLLDALALLLPKFPKLHVLVAGEGELRGALARQAAELGLEGNVHWLGNRSDIGALLATMDLFLLSSRSEGLPLALLEAIAAGVPVVSTDVGGISEVIQDGVSGTLVQAGAPASLAAAISARLGDPQGTRAMADRARRRFERDFTAAGMVRNVEKLYDEVLGVS